eukprot:CAMPEP_0181533844 /NCGR_PEP_ID=MMETSP1110-20121109/73386_1 /TAXON_ID=174948 /ORGANISM="Symbiodinium sp., Strain CCMP421" /LENGTH=219 /DNA_ID=CAMNT_0023665079 /DNA_START=69 /DNA_END=726 /DNA_ORIENTATION=+
MAAVIHELVMSCDLQGIKAAIKDMQQDGLDVQEEVNSHEFGRRGARSPVHAAAVRGRAEILQYLLKVKADPNNADDAGTTSMHFAADLGHSRVAYHLLQAGGDPSRRNGFGSRPTDKLVNNSWDTPEVLQGKDQIRRMIAGEHLPYEALRPEPDAPAEDKAVVSPVTSPTVATVGVEPEAQMRPPNRGQSSRDCFAEALDAHQWHAQPSQMRECQCTEG